MRLMNASGDSSAAQDGPTLASKAKALRVRKHVHAMMGSGMSTWEGWALCHGGTIVHWVVCADGIGTGVSTPGGVAMVGANGQVINPTITGGQSSGGIAASNVPKTGLNIVLDFGSNSGGGNGNGGGGNSNGSNGNGGDTAQSGPVAGSTTASASASSANASSTSASSSTASAATGLTSLAALANAITQSATASGADSTTSSASLANLASLALGLGSTASTLDEKQLAKIRSIKNSTLILRQ